MTPKLKVEFVSDVVCPWCVVGLRGLEQAIDNLRGMVDVELHFEPFELNAHLEPEGESLAEHIHDKYGSAPEQFAKMQQALTARGAEVGFRFNFNEHSRIWNSFDAHRLLHWAGLAGAREQQALKNALFRVHFTDNRNLFDREVLVDAAGDAGLDREQARAVLASGAYLQEVRQRESLWQRRGISAVPSVVIAGSHLIQGGQPAEVYERVLRDLAAKAAQAATAAPAG